MWLGRDNAAAAIEWPCPATAGSRSTRYLPVLVP
jgi:hypothetical protein